MAKSITANIGEKIEVRNTEGDLMGFFYFNPADPDIARRCDLVQMRLGEIIGAVSQENAQEDIEKLNREIKEQAGVLLGENAAETLFKYASPLSITPDGSLFAVYVFEIIFEFIKEELEKRSKNVKKAMDRYTEKYIK